MVNGYRPERDTGIRNKPPDTVVKARFEPIDNVTSELHIDGFLPVIMGTELARQIVRRWNVYETLKPEMNRLADKIVEISKNVE